MPKSIEKRKSEIENSNLQMAESGNRKNSVKNVKNGCKKWRSTPLDGEGQNMIKYAPVAGEMAEPG